MPITPAHAAAAWPLRAVGRRLPLVALVIGTVSPDLEYALRLRPEGRFGHTPLGLLVFCVPITLLLFWTWRGLVLPALLPLLPPGLRPASASTTSARGRAEAALLVIVAALLGALSHVVWDGFTHRTGWGVSLIPEMENVAPYFSLAWYSLAQYASSVAGVIVIALWIALSVRGLPVAGRQFAPGQRARLLRAVGFVASVALIVGAVNAASGRDIEERSGRAAVGTEAGFALGLVAWALLARSRVVLSPQ